MRNCAAFMVAFLYLRVSKDVNVMLMEEADFLGFVLKHLMDSYC